jgi:hypothetical protein
MLARVVSVYKMRIEDGIVRVCFDIFVYTQEYGLPPHASLVDQVWARCVAWIKRDLKSESIGGPSPVKRGGLNGSMQHPG